MPPSTEPDARQLAPLYTHHRLPDAGGPPGEGRPDGTFNCVGCGLVLGLTGEVVSRAFSGRLGRAYLVNSAVNVTLGPAEDRVLMTGQHTVRDAFCRGCSERVGWLYEAASEAAQRYKEGKFIIEKERVFKERGWDREVD